MTFQEAKQHLLENPGSKVVSIAGNHFWLERFLEKTFSLAEIEGAWQVVIDPVTIEHVFEPLTPLEVSVSEGAPNFTPSAIHDKQLIFLLDSALRHQIGRKVAITIEVLK